MNEIQSMEMALELARKGTGLTLPNPLVGAVIVKDGEVIGKGYHRKFGAAHAEVEAIDCVKARSDLKGSTLYVTLEPCNHEGKTPPCTKAIIEAGFKRVVVAMPDPNPLVAGRGIEALRGAGITVEVGLCEQEARRLNEAFIIYVTEGRPFVTLKLAVTLDGKVAAPDGTSRWITGPEARARVDVLRREAQAICVGVDTVIADDPSLRIRTDNPEDRDRDPLRIVLDSRGRFPLDCKLATENKDRRTIVVTTEKAPAESLMNLSSSNVEVWRVDLRNDHVDLFDLMGKLADRKVASLVVEGGPRVAGAFLRGGFVDKVLVFVTPAFLGSESRDAVEALGVTTLAEALRFTKTSYQVCGEDICITAYPKRESGETD